MSEGGISGQSGGLAEGPGTEESVRGCCKEEGVELEEDTVRERAEVPESKDADSLIEVRTSENRLRAEVRVVPFPDGTVPVPEAVLEALRAHGVVSGVDENAVKRLILQGEFCSWIPVAQGLFPKHGKDARLDVLVEMGESRPREVEDSDGKMDMKDLGLICNVQKGAVIAKKIPLEEGKDGLDVMGGLVKAKKGKDIRLLSGANTALSDDRLILTALTDGHLEREGNKFQVKPFFEVHGDVDYSTGNLSCYGGIKVRGAVKEGFRVEARNQIEVLGVIEGAEVVAGSDMIIKGSVRGMGQGSLSAGGSITAVYIDQCNISARRDLVFQKALMHNRIKVGRCVRAMSGTRGIITGGSLKVGIEVECQILGNEMGTKTEVFVGFPPELAEKRNKLMEDMENLEKKKGMIEKNLVYLGKVIRRDGIVPARKAQVEKFMVLRNTVLAQIAHGEKGLEAIKEAIDSLKQKSCVKVHGICYPGVSVSIRGVTFVTREAMRDVCFVYEKGAVLPVPLSDA